MAMRTDRPALRFVLSRRDASNRLTDELGMARILFLLAMAMSVFIGQPTFSAAQNLSQAEVSRQWDQAAELKNQGRYTEAAAIYERILPSAEAVYGKDGANLANLLNNLANLHKDLG